MLIMNLVLNNLGLNNIGYVVNCGTDVWDFP